jgi:hypothetical protein
MGNNTRYPMIRKNGTGAPVQFYFVAPLANCTFIFPFADTVYYQYRRASPLPASLFFFLLRGTDRTGEPRLLHVIV